MWAVGDVYPGEGKSIEVVLAGGMEKKESSFQPHIKKVRKKNQVLGFNCRLVELDMSPIEKQQLWVTDEIPFTEEARNFWNAWYRRAGTSLQKFLPLQSHYQALSSMQGFPLERSCQIRADKNSYWEEEKVTLIEERNISEDLFRLPAGMRKVTSVLEDEESRERLKRHKYYSSFD
ncbi:MAG: DUF4412 domain-containing protein [Candidatus Omnitrophica bacterium]|nr:DUF4412 domain-containing protein [Candidatus Omnitrophota bacterium]